MLTNIRLQFPVLSNKPVQASLLRDPDEHQIRYDNRHENEQYAASSTPDLC